MAWGRTAREALKLAQEVDARMAAHDAGCTERWKEARDTWQRVERAVEGLRAADGAQSTALVAGRTSWMGPALTVLGIMTTMLLGAVATETFYLLTHTH